LNDTPEQVNEDPYKNGWMVKIELDNNADQSKLLDAKSYIELIG
jgi:glycine cleavage system H protein